MLLAGTYYAKITPEARVNDAAYTLTSHISYVPADTAGNNFDTARKITANGTVNDWLGLGNKDSYYMGDKDDYYKLELQSGTTMTLNLTGLSSNVNLYLYDNNKKQLATSTKAGDASESITKYLEAGTYYVKATIITSLSDTFYDLTFNIDPAAFKPGSLLLSGAASPLTGGADASQTDPLKKTNGLLAS
jgi:hypothetical protein